MLFYYLKYSFILFFQFKHFLLIFSLYFFNFLIKFFSKIYIILINDYFSACFQHRFYKNMMIQLRFFSITFVYCRFQWKINILFNLKAVSNIENYLSKCIKKGGFKQMFVVLTFNGSFVLFVLFIPVFFVFTVYYVLIFRGLFILFSVGFCFSSSPPVENLLW